MNNELLEERVEVTRLRGQISDLNNQISEISTQLANALQDLREVELEKDELRRRLDSPSSEVVLLDYPSTSAFWRQR